MAKVNWIVTSGKAEVKDNTIKYKSETFKNQLGVEEVLTSLVKSNITFDNGEISFSVKSKSQDARCQVVFNYDESPMILVGLNVLNGLYGIAKFNKTSNNFEPLSTTGLSDTFNVNQEYKIKIKVSGSIIELYINEVLVCVAFEQVLQSQVTFFFSSLDEISVKDIEIVAKQPKAFVVMQFTDEYNDLYKEVIKPVVENYGFEQRVS